MKVILTSKAYKQLTNLDNKTQERLKSKLKQLKNFPYVKLDIKKIKGLEDVYRLRVGNYRVLFEVNYFDNVIRIFYIDHRRKIYKRFPI